MIKDMSMQYKAKVLGRTSLSGDKMALRTTIPDSFIFQPGQYTILNLGDGEPDINADARYVSMASSPHEDTLLFVMNTGTSEFKKKYMALARGQEVLLTDPGGMLSIPHKHPAVYLAGGVGVTPFRSILRDRFRAAPEETSYLFYSAPNRARCLFYDEFSAATRMHKNFQFIPTFTRDVANDISAYDRRIDATMITQHIPDPDQVHYYIAGSHPYIRGMQQVLTSLAIPPSRWTIEVFCGYCPDHICCCEYVGVPHEDHEHRL